MSRSAKRNDPDASPQPARRGRARPAGEDALSHAAAALSRAGFSDATLVLRWREIAGAELARVARPLKLTEGPEGAVLTLKCDSGSAVFLQHQTRELLERLNRYLGAQRVVRLRLISGEFASISEPSDHPGQSAPSADEAGGDASLSGAIGRLARRRRSAKPKRAD